MSQHQSSTVQNRWGWVIVGIVIVVVVILTVLLLLKPSLFFVVTPIATNTPPTQSTSPLVIIPSTPTATLNPATTTTQFISPLTTTKTVPNYTYRVINTYPHDRSAFTQGLIFLDGIFYEGTGLRGQSTLRKVDVETGQVLQQYNLPEQYFGEGITILDDKLIQLTWQSRVGFVYDKESFTLEQEFHYPTEGWGLTYDGQQLIMSDGTANLYFLNPETFAEIGRIKVQDNNGPVVFLNELEYIQGEIFANVWKTDRIVKISPQTGAVTGSIDLTGLLQPSDREGLIDVLNGIAYDAEGSRLFVTGKWWPKVFEIVLIPAEVQ